jgi:homoserine kinase type II
MAAAAKAGLEFVPRVLATTSGKPWAEAAGRLWDLTTWMPGRADFQVYPTRQRLQAACTALGQLHQAWLPVTSAHGPCPGVLRRLEGVQEWTRLVASGWRPLDVVSASDTVRRWVERAWPHLLQRMDQIPRALASWTTQSLPLQPCLCDVWHDHVLFTGDVVTGLVDYGAAKIDHVAVDLARLLGSLVEDNAEERAAGLRAYAQTRRLAAEDERLVIVLDETGTIVGIANWLIWLYAEGRPFADRIAVADRLGKLVVRLERWTNSV